MQWWDEYLKAGLSYLPYYLWNGWEGGKMAALVEPLVKVILGSSILLHPQPLWEALVSLMPLLSFLRVPSSWERIPRKSREVPSFASAVPRPPTEDTAYKGCFRKAGSLDFNCASQPEQWWPSRDRRRWRRPSLVQVSPTLESSNPLQGWAGCKCFKNEFDHRSGNKKAADLASQFLEDVTTLIITIYKKHSTQCNNTYNNY